MRAACLSHNPQAPTIEQVSLLFAVSAVNLLHDIWLWLRMPPRAPAPQDEVMDTVRTVVETLWSDLHEMNWSKAHNRYIRAVDLLETRSMRYSSRPRIVAMSEILWDGASILVQPYGKE